MFVWFVLNEYFLIASFSFLLRILPTYVSFLFVNLIEVKCFSTLSYTIFLVTLIHRNWKKKTVSSSSNATRTGYLAWFTGNNPVICLLLDWKYRIFASNYYYSKNNILMGFYCLKKILSLNFNKFFYWQKSANSSQVGSKLMDIF